MPLKTYHRINMDTLPFIKTKMRLPLLWCWGWQWSPPTHTAGFWWWLTYPVGPPGCHGATSCLFLVSAYHNHTIYNTEMIKPCLSLVSAYHTYTFETGMIKLCLSLYLHVKLTIEIKLKWSIYSCPLYLHLILTRCNKHKTLAIGGQCIMYPKEPI